MAIDPPARLAILGAGPIGLEAALYARFLGYHVDLLEQGEVADSVRRWGHVTMFSPFHMNASPLGLAALRAQDETYEPPDRDALLTGLEWIENYLLPLAQTDLLADHIHTGHEVIAVGRPAWRKTDLPGADARGEDDFLLLTESAEGEQTWLADAVIDATGVFRCPHWLGPGGIPAVGERRLQGEIEYGLPDVLGADRARYSGRRTLVVGAGYSAATTVTALAELAREDPDTRIVWAVRRATAEPMTRLSNDRLPARDTLAANANRLVSTAAKPVDFRAGVQVREIQRTGERWEVTLGPVPSLDGEEGEGDNGDSPLVTETFDAVVANVGYRGDDTIFRELQVHQCYATGGPIKLAAALLQADSADCLEPVESGVDALCNPEPDFYLLGAKSYGRNPRFLFSQGLEQIRQLFTRIGDRADLDLYSTCQDLPR